MAIVLRRLEAADEAQFLDAVRPTADLHDTWASPPHSPDEFQRYFQQARGQSKLAYPVNSGRRGLPLKI